MKIIVERAKCTGLGICESLAPEVFEVDDSGELVLLEETITEHQIADVEAAVTGCPTEALRLER
ncbi:ferredoxin [Amycolatopsis sp. K13G38]|uniref:Ferredoxin n=1 Tax=Amycolatopsis acididurans TaxID=2724524 RepID=A0ABX1J7D1_9PSEU|nr:ferredoxin [Amycolatopsis acididurans]NKQ54202.1 ferredoxin [Amycolatopsis acididurans]